jgi:hypothetical protein
MAYRPKKRRSARRTSRRRTLRANPLTTKQKLIGIGGIVVVGGVAAYALTSGTGAGGGATTGPVGSPAANKAAECSAIQSELETLRAAATPDRATMQQLETRLATCIAEARALNAPVDPALAKQSDGDVLLSRILAWFEEFKGTDRSDVLKRGNIRGEMARAGTAMATAYRDAANASTSDAATQSIRQSILRALDASMMRRLCYHYAVPQCDRYDGSVEPHYTQKEAEEKASTFVPLMEAHQAAVAKLGGPTSSKLRAADNDLFFDILMRACAQEKDLIDRKFAEYKTVDPSNALRRNNLRVGEVRDRARGLVACLTEASELALTFRYVPALRRLATLLVAAFDASTLRWLCFLLNLPGCGTFAANEDQPDAKAAQERDWIMKPLSALFVRVATEIVRQGADMTVFEPYTAARVRVAVTLRDYANAKFAEYKSIGGIDGTGSDDPARRNNLRQVVLWTGENLVEQLRDTVNIITNSAKIVPTPVFSQAVVAAMSRNPILLNMPTAGLGQMMMMPLTTLVPSTAVVRPAAPNQLQEALKAASIRQMRSAAVVANAALTASVTRQLCFLAQEPGCRTFGANEDQPSAKAEQEAARVGRPLLAVCASAAKYLIDNGDPSAAQTIDQEQLRFCVASKNFLDAKFAELHTVPYHDPWRRNNVRDDLIRNGRGLVTCLRNMKPMSPAGSAAWRSLVQAAKDASLARSLCYSNRQSGCDRSGDIEPEGMAKYNEEKSAITDPLQALLNSGPGVAGLGSFLDEGFAGISGYAWLGIGAAALVGVAAYQSSKKSTRRNRRRRRTSRRLRLTA